MENLMNLKFTKKTMDTSMAEEYVKKINESTDWPENGQYHVETNQTNTNKYKTLGEVSDFILQCKVSTLKISKTILAKKIKEHAEMFVQLEYLTRGTDPRDVRDGHIKLMYQLTMCGLIYWKCSSTSLLYFNNTTSLYNLAATVVGLFSDLSQQVNPTFVVVGDKRMRPLCKYFVDLCRDVGFNIPMVYANPDDVENLKRNDKLIFWEESSDNMGCTGVVAERSDIDSAIDVFIDSSVTAPWRLKQIYVQESVFEYFKEAFAAKAHAILPTCLTVRDKIFMYESLKKEQGGIPIHAYRTTKELLTFIKTPYLSVWAAESAVSNEIALLSSSSTVWVNDYGLFYGPPRTASSVYDLVTKSLTVPDKIMETLKSWSKLGRNERIEIIAAALQTYQNTLCVDHLYTDNNIVETTEKTVCIGIQKTGVLTVVCDHVFSFSDILKNLVAGNAVVFNCLTEHENKNALCTKLQNNGAPIEFIKPGLEFIKADCPPQHFIAPRRFFLERLKVIRTNYGTIFAN